MARRKKVHQPYNALKGKLRELGLTYQDVADTLGISTTAVSYKVQGVSDFYISEVSVLEKAFCLNHNIFFENKVSNMITM